MAWSKGQSGNPKGRPTEKPFADALRMEIAAAGDDRKALREIARALLDKARSGELASIQEVANRLDGKPAQEATLTIDDKRDNLDWTRDELVAFLNNARANSPRATEADGRDAEPDSVH